MIDRCDDQLIMVTIANYLNGSFLAAEINESERPVCLLEGWNDG